MGIKKVSKLPGVKTLKGKAAKLLKQATETGKKAVEKSVAERNRTEDRSFFSPLYIGPESSNPFRADKVRKGKLVKLPHVMEPPFIDPDLKRELEERQRARNENRNHKGDGTYKK